MVKRKSVSLLFCTTRINKILPKLSSACCVVRSVYYYIKMSTLKIIMVHTFMLEWSMALYFVVSR